MHRSDSRNAIKQMLQDAAGGPQASPGDAFWESDAVESLSFEDASDVNSGGTVSVYGSSGYVRLELVLPAALAAEIIEHARTGKWTQEVKPENELKTEIAQERYLVDVITSPPRLVKAPVKSEIINPELEALIASQAQDDASDTVVPKHIEFIELEDLSDLR